MKKAAVLALVFALAALFAVSVSAADETEPFAFLEIEGLTEVEVTSSMSDPEDTSSALLFDKLRSTGAVFTVSEGERTFSVYTASRVPESIAAFAAYLEGESGTVVGVNAFGTNDNSLETWATLISDGDVSLIDGFRFFPVDEPLVRFAFYRFDFTVTAGDGFTLSELALFATENDDPEMEYATLTSVELGETLPLVPKTEYEKTVAAEEAPAPAFGVNCLRPGLRK